MEKEERRKINVQYGITTKYFPRAEDEVVEKASHVFFIVVSQKRLDGNSVMSTPLSLQPFALLIIRR